MAPARRRGLVHRVRSAAPITPLRCGLDRGGSIPHPVGLASPITACSHGQLPVLQRILDPAPAARIGQVVSRTAGSAAFPARFQFVGAANPCRRGCASFRACICSPAERAHYLSRLSRPLLDRIDLHLEIPAVPYALLASPGGGESSSAIRERVEVARARHTSAVQAPAWASCAHDRAAGGDVRRAADAAKLLALAVTRLGPLSRGHTASSGRPPIAPRGVEGIAPITSPKHPVTLPSLRPLPAPAICVLLGGEFRVRPLTAILDTR